MRKQGRIDGVVQSRVRAQTTTFGRSSFDRLLRRFLLLFILALRESWMPRKAWTSPSFQNTLFGLGNFFANVANITRNVYVGGANLTVQRSSFVQS